MSLIQQSIPLAPLTTLGVGGSAEYFVEVTSEVELVEVLAHARQEKLPVSVIAGGSNVCVDDAGVSGLVIRNKLKGLNHTADENLTLLTCGAGEVFDEVVAFSVAKGWWGLENLSAIPGSVGATPIQNVGAYGVEVAELIVSVTAIHIDTGEKKVFTNDDCTFSYRNSYFKTEAGRQWVVVSVTYRLQNTPKPKLHYKDLANAQLNETQPTIDSIRKEVISIRSQKFPDWHELGTAGSFFKNPIVSQEKARALLKEYPDWPHFVEGKEVKFSLSWFLDRVLNLKGVSDGPVGTYEKHVLVLVNHGGATAADVESFAQKITNEFFSATKIKIEWEVTKL